ncbi:MAG: hypothetical protein ACN6I4_01860 [bacterium]
MINVTKGQVVNYDSLSQIDNKIVKDTINKLQSKNKLLNKSNFSLGGSLFVEAQVAKSQYNFQQTPLNYVRTTISPNISLWGIPFTTQINLTTEQFQTNYNLNRIQVSLDIKSLSEQYKNKLLDRLQDSAADTAHISKYRKILEDSVNKLNAVDLDFDKVSKKYDSSEVALKSYETNYNFSEADSLKEFSLSERLQYKEFLKLKKEHDENKLLYDSLKQVVEASKKLKQEFETFNKTHNQINPRQVQELKQNNKKRLSKKFRSHSYLSRAERLILSIRDLKLGTIFTGNNNSALQGATINGIAIENSFGKIFTSVQAGILQQNLAFGQLQQAKNNSYLYALKAGYGMPENTHLHAGIIRSGKMGKGAKNKEIVSIPVPENSTIYNLDGAIILNENIRLEGDWAIANNQQSIGSPHSNESFSTATITNQLLQRPNTSYSIKATSYLLNRKTKIVAQQNYVGANFYTPGNIFLRNDIRRQKVKISQKLYKGFISADISYQNDEDNLLNQKSHTTTVKNYKAALKIRLRKLPSFIASYNLIEQATQSNISEQNFSYLNAIHVYSITSVYTKRIKNNILTSSITYIRQNLVNNFSSVKRAYNNITTTSSLSNSKGDNITWVGTLSNSILQQNTLMVNNQLEASYVHRKNEKFITTVGGHYTYDDFLGDNGGVFLRQVLSVWKKNSIALLIRQNFYKGVIAESKTIHQSIINIQFLQQW